MDYVSAKTMGVFTTRLPSAGRFFNALSVDYIFGMPVSASAAGLSMDVGLIRNLVKVPDGTKDKQIQFMMTSGVNSSVLEHSVPEQLFSTPDNPAHGISAVKALAIANEQGMPIYTIDQANIGTVMPQLQIDGDVKADIQNAVNAGKEVTVSKSNITFNGWTGCGYIIVDTVTGAGAYMISGGLSGGFLVKELRWFLSVMRDPTDQATINYFAGLIGTYGLVITVFMTAYAVVDILFNSDNTASEKLCAIAATVLSQLFQFALGFATHNFPKIILVTLLSGFLLDALSTAFITKKCGQINYII